MSLRKRLFGESTFHVKRYVMAAATTSAILAYVYASDVEEAMAIAASFATEPYVLKEWCNGLA